MFANLSWMAFLLWCLYQPSITAAQGINYQFTLSADSLARGRPFVFTWTGGQPTDRVYIIRNYLFPNTPDMEIPYIETEILSNAPNTGSFTYDVPSDLLPGRYTFSIGVNPFLLSDTSKTFTITPSPTSSINDPTITPFISPSSSTSASLNRRDSTNSTTNLWGWNSSATGSRRILWSSGTPERTYDTISLLSDLGKNLQCAASTATVATTTITNSDVISILTYVGCPGTGIGIGTGGSSSTTATATATIDPSGGVCHPSGYVTYSAAGVYCCPSGWGTTRVTSDLFCTTQIDLGSQPASEGVSPGPSITEVLGVSGVVFTRAGVVRNEAVRTGTGTGVSGSGSGSESGSGPGPVATGAGDSRNAGGRLSVEMWRIQGVVAIVAGALLCMC